MITTTDIKLGVLFFNGEACPDPIIDFIGAENLAVKCIDNENGIYRVQSLDGEPLPACLTFIVRCGSCSDCPPKVIERCLCDVNTPCTGSCQDCVGGICVDRCKNGEVCINDTCKSCTTADQCPCNQICTATGCQCPVGTTKNPLNDCCDQCQSSKDCGPCNDCVNIGGANFCVARDCGTGVCDPTTDSCVGCLSSGDCTGSCTECDPITKMCVAGTGYIQIGVLCIPAPECTTDADCNDPCLACGPAGTCIPIQCPGSQIPARIGNICTCVDSCDCDDPGSCDDITKYCSAVDIANCGCLPCQGDCASGCEDPCYCSPLLNKCVANTCSDAPCVNGIDCGPNCGCQGGKCVPCESLSCTDSSCAEVLGCKCAGLSCVADDCGNAPCTTPFDCPLGCTCDDGKCVGCSNFPCTGINECAQQERCKCVNGNCEGDDDADCKDTLALIKNDEDCSLTGSLLTENCCACSPFTLAIKGQRQSSSDTTYTISFHAELRKGTYNGVNIDANPLLDDLTNENIAENEVPTSGTISYQSYTTYAIYKDMGSGYTFTGNSVEGPDTGLTSYVGATAKVLFPSALFKKIGVTEQVDANTQREAVSVEIEFFQSSHLITPNGCIYRSTVSIGKYQIFSDDDWQNFSATEANNGIATTVTSSVCRDPFFKWRKDGEVFHKLYVSGNNNIYSNLLENPPIDELESCSTYSLEVDCSCEKTISDLVTFCNPANIDFVIQNCGKTFKLNSFSTCGPNLNQEFYIKGGTIDVKFLGSNPPIGTLYNSDTCIEELTYGLSCDDECNTIYTNAICGDFDIDFTTLCDEDGGTFDVTFDSTATDESGNTYNVDKIVIGGFTLTPGTGFTATLPWGTYVAVVYPSGGCDSFNVDVNEDCCSAGVDEISRDCDGSIACTQDPNITYEVGGVVQGDICAYVNALSSDQSVTIVIKKGGCPDRQITLPSLASFCCDNYMFIIEQQGDNTALVQVYSGGIGISLQVTPALGITVTDSGPNEFIVDGLVIGQTYQFTVNSETCGTLVLPHDQTECAIPVSLVQPAAPNCDSLVASVTNQVCTCKFGEFRSEIQSTNVVGPNVEITFQTSIQQFDADPVGGTIVFTDYNGLETDLGCITCVKTISFPAPTSIVCLDGISLLVTMIEDTNQFGDSTVEIEILSGGQPMSLDPNLTAATIDANGTPLFQDADGAFIWPTCCPSGITINLIVSITDANNVTYHTTVNVGPVVLGSPINQVLSNICTDGSNPVEVPLTLELRGLELEDNCDYPTVIQNFTYLSNSETTVPSGPQTIGLSATNPNDRYVKFIWAKDGSPVFTQFHPTTSALPNIYLDQGSDYEVKAVCDPCEDTAEQEFCCIPTVTFDAINCLDAVDIIVEGLPGTYELDFFGTPYTIILVGAGITSDTVTYNGPLTGGFDYPVTLTVQGTTCVDSYIYTPSGDIVPVLAFSDCNPGTSTFDMTVTNAEPGWMTTISSGSGVVAPNGVDILSISELDPPVFYIEEGTCRSSNILGTPPTTCFSSSTAATSSSAPVSSSVAASSSAVGSSSLPASSSGTSSIITSSSTPQSSSIGASSSVTGSALPPSSSPQAASSSAAGSSSAPEASSSAPGSSTADPSSTVVNPSSCGTILEITQSFVFCTYSLEPVNPDTGSSTYKVTVTDDQFFWEMESQCRLTSSCQGLLSLAAAPTLDMESVAIMRAENLIAGDAATTMWLYDGPTNAISLDVSPTGNIIGCGCTGCGVVNFNHLTYGSGTNEAQFAFAIYQTAINELCDQGYTKGVDYEIDWGYTTNKILIQFTNKHNPSTLIYPTSNAAIPHANVADLVQRVGVGIATVYGTINEYDTSITDTSITPTPCSVTTNCGSLNGTWTAGGSGNSLTYGTIVPGVWTINGLTRTNNCSHSELVATLTGAACPTPSFNWTGPAAWSKSGGQTIYTTIDGTYEVDVTGCPGCGTLEDSEIVGGGGA